MQIDRLCLRNFRNYADAEIRFVSGVNLLVGGNANGGRGRGIIHAVGQAYDILAWVIMVGQMS